MVVTFRLRNLNTTDMEIDEGRNGVSRSRLPTSCMYQEDSIEFGITR